jgi:aspartyl-tRNA(Asn)/glutamyl-tRNA(Gln) amidotransferase subunit A
MHTIPDAAVALATGATTARKLIEDSLARIADPAGEGSRVFIKTYATQARAAADAVDALRAAGRVLGPYAGIPISAKDLFDIAGDPTPAGSKVLADAPPATANAPLIQRMIDAGFIIVGRSNMTEFAFSGLGINPHYGTPSSPWDRATGRIPGGSSSGAAVSVADHMAFAGLGTDTGGSCRVPAAMCGVVGYKPTSRRVPITGVLPLAPSLDSVGPLARSVACCAIIDAVLAGNPPPDLQPAPVAGLRLAVPQNVMLEGIDSHVAAAFEQALAKLAQAGAHILPTSFPVFGELAAANARGGFAAAEAYAWHRHLLATKACGYDPRIRQRIIRGEGMTAAAYLDLIAARATLIAKFDAATQDFDALVMPTCPLIPPAIEALDDEAEYNRVNMLQLRNTTVGNFFDRCAISLPCHQPGEAPVGLMLMGETMGDPRLLRIAAGVERALAYAG